MRRKLFLTEFQRKIDAFLHESILIERWPVLMLIIIASIPYIGLVVSVTMILYHLLLFMLKYKKL